MADRDLTLQPRAEGVRESRPVVTPVHFTPQEILAHYNESIDGIKRQFQVAKDLQSAGNEDGGKTIWRSQVVLAEGLLDYFIHEVSKYCLFQMFTGQWDKTDKYGSFMVPLSKVEQAISTKDTAEWFFEFINERLARDVFLSNECMRDQLNLIGVGYVPAMVKAFPRDKEETSKKDGAMIVQELFRRRNEIAHQNDRSHANAEQTDITEEYVIEYLGKIDSIVTAIIDIIMEKNT